VRFSNAGFSLLEILFALIVMSFGLLAAAGLLALAATSGSLTKSMDCAVLSAQGQLEFLEDLYQRDPDSPDLLPGDHSGNVLEFKDAAGNQVLQKLSVSWSVSVPDPKPGPEAGAILITVSAVPAPVGQDHHPAGNMAKGASFSTIIAAKGIP
jgi:type II secretory pathway pseudopilin PulG